MATMIPNIDLLSIANNGERLFNLLQTLQDKLDGLEVPEDQIFRLANREHADFILIVGDVFDNGEDIYPSVPSLFVDYIKSFHKKVYIVPGNHDLHALNSIYRKPIWPSNAVIFEGLEIEKIGGLKLIAYGQSDYDSGFLSKIANCVDHPSIVAIHGSVKELSNKDFQPNCSNDNTKCLGFSTQELISLGADYIALGHVSAPWSLKKGDNIIAAYSGKPYNIFKNKWISIGAIGRIFPG